MASANTVNTSATASTQRLRMRSQNSLPAMMPIWVNSIEPPLIGKAEEYVFERRFAHMQVEYLAVECSKGFEHGHLGFAPALHRDVVVIGFDGADRQMAQGGPHCVKVLGGDADVEPQRQTHLLAQGLDAADGPDSTLGHDRETVDAFLDLGKDVRSQHHRHPFRPQAAQDYVELADRLRVQEYPQHGRGAGGEVGASRR